MTGIHDPAQLAYVISETERAEAERVALIERLCRLQRPIAELAIGFGQPIDCFCRQDGADPVGPGWRNVGAAVEFIEQAVEEKLARRQATEADAQDRLRRLVAELALRAGVTAEDLQAVLS